MENKDCSCNEFEELRGASVNGYISAFLEAGKSEKNHFVCRICGSIWENRKTDDATKPILVKIKQAENKQEK